ncbi:MAG: cytidylate kinase family protein [Spirochaetia bacterium]|nr:cytidylate kinase family protein [Spirochaetia bacterium]
MKDLSKIKIAVSGKSGCGNSTVSRLLAEKLGLKLINYTFHNMAEEAGIPFEEFCRKAENDPSYDYALDKKQIDLASAGGVVLGSRLAVWLLKDADLKVYLYAPAEIRATRVHNREGGCAEERAAETEARDARDTNRYRRLYNIDNNDYAFCDLIIDTSDKNPEQIVTEIIEAVYKAD